MGSATLAHLLRSNLLPLSYVPEKPVRLNRELLRYRASLVRIQSGVKNKIHTVLAKNNVSHGYSDLLGKEGMTFLHSLALPENKERGQRCQALPVSKTTLCLRRTCAFNIFFWQYVFSRAHNQTGLQVVTLDTGRGSHPRREKTRGYYGVSTSRSRGRKEGRLLR